MHRSFSTKFDCYISYIHSGELYVSTNGDVISTILGSCVSVCLTDLEAGIGGLNHFMLPFKPGESKIDVQDGALQVESLEVTALRYGAAALERLIGALQKNGAKRNRLQAKIFGGASSMIHESAKQQTIGQRNVAFARAFLRSEEIPVLREDVGGIRGRRIFFIADENRVFVETINLRDTLHAETVYLRQLRGLKRKGSIELFE